MQVFAIIVFGCISSQGWSWEDEVKREVCILNRTPSACHFPTFVGVIAFLVSIGLLVGEWFFEQMSSIKTRKHFVIVDMGFSGMWAFFYFVAFVYMCIAWSKTDEEFSYGSSNIIGAIFFALLSVGSWVSCLFLIIQYYMYMSLKKQFLISKPSADSINYSTLPFI